jgi:hypothetical protein
MYSEIRGAVPKLPFSFAPTLVNRAWQHVRESNLWSFNLFESSWISPPLVTTGTVTATQGLAAIQFDATAQAALTAAQAAQPYSLITQRQFRISVGGIYNILTYNPLTGAATLDRPFGDPGGSGLAYQIYQLYYPAPFLDHRVWLSVRNPQMFLDLDLTSTRAQVDAMDPQRTWYQFPSRVVPFGRDLRGAGTTNASATLNFPLFELWGQPITPFVYQCYGVRNGADLINPSDTLPPSLDEDLILAKARVYAYKWAEANQGITPRNVGPDYRFLIKDSEDEFARLLKLYRKQDKELTNNWLTSRGGNTSSVRAAYYNTLSGVAGPYFGQ